MPPFIVTAFDKNQSGLAPGGSPVELAFCWRHPPRILGAVLLAVEAKVEPAVVYVIEINLVGSAIRSGLVLKQKHIKETTEQRIAAHKIADGPPFLGQFLLDTADKKDRFLHRFPALSNVLANSSRKASLAAATSFPALKLYQDDIRKAS
jgi:hypothetical protein